MSCLHNGHVTCNSSNQLSRQFLWKACRQGNPRIISRSPMGSRQIVQIAWPMKRSGNIPSHSLRQSANSRSTAALYTACVFWLWPARKVLVNLWSRMQMLYAGSACFRIFVSKSCSLREDEDYENSFADKRHVSVVQNAVTSRPFPVWRVEGGVGAHRYERVVQWEGHILRRHFRVYLPESLMIHIF
jgi:hypothetical protein